MEKIVDFISGKDVQATPEEVEAVQPFAHILVEDYGYSKDQIQTHPQYRVQVRPSDMVKEYPVDIAVFKGSGRDDKDIQIVIECKRNSRKDGLIELQDYLRFCKAEFGVWFNGNERLYLHKVEHDGKIEFSEIPNIPSKGQRFEDIGLYKRKDLKAPHNLKSIFKAIRNHLAGNTVGTTRDEVLAQQIINLIFCKIYDERFTEPDKMCEFRAGYNEAPSVVKKRIDDLFDKVKRKYKEVIDPADEISLDDNSVFYVVGELQNYCLIEAERDSIADAFETFIGHALKGAQGQFFTPRNVIRMMVDIVDPSDEDLIIDPSCGSGGFLVESLRHIWKKLEDDGVKYGWTDSNLKEEKLEVALNKIRGIDKDYFLAKVAKAYMAILGDGKSGIFCEDSLEIPTNWNEKTRIKIDKNKFSVLLTNPPFGSKIPVSGEEKLAQYDLAHKWKRDAHGTWVPGKLKERETPQVLFIERDVQLLVNRGIMAIVLPDGVFGNENFGYVRTWLKKHGRILGVIDLPTETFQPNTATKTSVLVFQKLIPEEIPSDYSIFMAIVNTCGHDRRGNQIDSDEIGSVAAAFHEWSQKQDILKIED